MHVGGVFLFNKPQEFSEGFIEQLVAEIKKSKSIPIQPFNNVLNGIFWKLNQDFDPNVHFSYVRMLQKTSLNELYEYISEQHAVLLNRKQPLWHCTLIDGLEKNQFALYIKIHHALVDGIAAMRLMEKAFSSSPHADKIVPPWISHKKITTRSKTTESLTEQLKTTPKVIYTELKQAILHDRKHHPDYVTSFQAPRCILNQRINTSRKFIAQSFELQRIKNIAQSLNITLNDAILALCSGALRHYLDSLKSLPSVPLVAMVPASVRSAEDHDLSNRITMILANLATTTKDPIERAQTISRSVTHSKTRFKRMTQNQIFGYSAFVYAAAGLNILSGLIPKRQAFNIVISNVPGPKEPLYWNGAKLEAVFPASVIFDGQALNITITSYLEKLEIGLLGCPDILPHIDVILDHLNTQILQYEQILKEQIL